MDGDMMSLMNGMTGMMIRKRITSMQIFYSLISLFKTWKNQRKKNKRMPKIT